jgi:hypothetical protein
VAVRGMRVLKAFGSPKGKMTRWQLPSFKSCPAFAWLPGRRYSEPVSLANCFLEFVVQIRVLQTFWVGKPAVKKVTHICTCIYTVYIWI